MTVCMHSPQHSLHLGLSESCQFLFTRALMNSAVLKSMKGTSAQPVIHRKIPPTSPSQNSFFCCQCHCLIPEGINDRSRGTVLQRYCASESLGGSVKTQIIGPHSLLSEFVHLGWGPICISNKFLGDVDALFWGPHFENN